MNDANLAAAPASGLFESNMRALAERFPDVAGRLEQITERVSTRLPPPAENISIDGTLLYPTDASEWVRLQMEGNDAFGERIVVPVNRCNASVISAPLGNDCTAYCDEHGLALAPTRVRDVGLHLVFGIGLGRHVPLLVDKTAARDMVLIEPVPEFLLHSMDVVDWAAIFQRAEERRITLHFVFEDKPAAITRAIEKLVVQRDRPFLDSSYCYFHYYSWVLREAFKSFSEHKRQIEINAGFFEDEKVMMTNAFGNFAGNAFHQLAGKRYVEQKAPLFICGSGPSLRTTMEEIRKWRQHVVLMSCGTSLGPLLEAGLRPDLHVENENVDEVYNIISRLDRQYGLHGITLIASTTVKPNVPPLFDRAWFYQRGALTASTILSPDVLPVHGVDPLVSNAGYSVGATLGFRQIYLFGTDCGARRMDDHHVSGAYKFATDEEKRQHDEMWAKRFDREVPGNFGGKVWSAWHLDVSRRMFEEAQSRHRVDLYNCSNGARIAGAKPKAPRSLRFEAPIDATRVLANIANQVAHFDKGEYVKTIAFDTPLAALDEYCAWVRSRFDDIRKGGTRSYYDLYQAVKLPAGHSKDWQGPDSFIGSSIEAMVWLVAYFGDRIEDAEARNAFFDYSLDRIEERLDILFAGAREFLTDLAAQAR